MRRLSLFLLAASAIFATACGSGKKAAKSTTTDTPYQIAQVKLDIIPLKITYLPGYFMKSLPGEEDVSGLMVFKDQQAFDARFGIAQTMGATIATPDFYRNIIAAFATPATANATTITADRAEQEGALYRVFLTVTTGEAQSFTIKPVSVFAIQRGAYVSQIDVYVNNKLSQEVMLSDI